MIVFATSMQIYNGYSALRSAKMKLKVSSVDRSMLACQSCVLDGLGATRMRAISKAEGGNTNFVTYQISGLDFVFSNTWPNATELTYAIFKN